MTKQDWKLDTITVEEIIEHLKEHHNVEFNDRRSLSEDNFREEHFPELIQHMEIEDYRYRSFEGQEKLKQVKQLLKKVLKHCEENKIPIARVFDDSEIGEGEWRICKPTTEQLAYLRIFRWFRISAGNFVKAMFQAEMLEELSEEEIKEYAKELQESVLSDWEKKQIIIQKKKRRKEQQNDI